MVGTPNGFEAPAPKKSSNLAHSLPSFYQIKDVPSTVISILCARSCFDVKNTKYQLSNLSDMGVLEKA